MQLGCADQPFERWLVDMLRIPPLDVRQDTRYHALRFLENGITTTLHSHYVRDSSRYHAEVEEVLAGYADVGMRVAFAPHYIDRNFLTYGEDEPFLASLPPELMAGARGFTQPPITADAYLSLVRSLADQADSASRRILLGPVAPQWCSEQMLRRIGEIVRSGERGAHLHLLETPAQRAYLDESLGHSIVDLLDNVGLLGPTVSFAHGVWLRPSEMALMADRGSSLVLNPGCNLRLGNGTPPIGELVEHGVDLAVGTDDMSLGDDDDLFGEVRLVSALARVSGAWLDSATLLRAATWGGARAAQFADLVGTLEPGKRADVVLLDATRIVEPATLDGVSMLDLTVARARGADVRTVVLDGQIVFDERAHRVMDRDDVVEAVAASAAAQTMSAEYGEFARVVTRLAAARGAWPFASASRPNRTTS